MGFFYDFQADMQTFICNGHSQTGWVVTFSESVSHTEFKNMCNMSVMTRRANMNFDTNCSSRSLRVLEYHNSLRELCVLISGTNYNNYYYSAQAAELQTVPKG